MNSYLQGFITGTVFISAFFIFTGLNSVQLEAVENEIIKIWEKEKVQDQLIKINQSKSLDIESEININTKSTNLYVKSLQKQIDKLKNQLNEHCECYRNQILSH